MKKSVRVAAAQMAPVFMERDATVEKVCRAILDAGQNAAQVARRRDLSDHGPLAKRLVGLREYMTGEPAATIAADRHREASSPIPGSSVSAGRG
jgi:hypothetical protein